jgi:pyridoxal biosynthesis lyase PdxS
MGQCMASIFGAMAERATFRVKTGLAEMLKGGVIMDVTNVEQAKIAEEAGACAVMALERVPADIRAEGGVGDDPGDGEGTDRPFRGGPGS